MHSHILTEPLYIILFIHFLVWRTCTHVLAHTQPAYTPRPFLCREVCRLQENGTSVYSERFKDNLPGLEEPSVPAIPDCFGGVSINTEQAAWHAVQWKGRERLALKRGLMPLLHQLLLGAHW